jgi:VanZ family protein
LGRNYFLYIALCLTTVITIGSLISMKDVVETKINFFDKIIHVGAYLILTLSWLLSYRSNAKSLKNHFLIAIAVFVYGIIIEVLQATFTSNRQADIYDVFANLVGITISFFIFAVVYQKKQMN